MPLLRPDQRKVLVPCVGAADARAFDAVRAHGMQAAGLFSTRLFDLDRPAPVADAAYVKWMSPEAVISAARLFGAEAVFAPTRQPVLESSCRFAGIGYLDPGTIRAN